VARFALTTFVTALLLTACSSPKATGPGAMPHDPSFANFVSMAPSNTELLYALNAKEELVGVCTQCDYPPAVKEKPKVGSFTSVDLEKLTMLHPEGVVLVNGQEAIANTLKSHGIQSVILNNNKVHDVSLNIKRLGRITHRSAMAISLTAEFDKHVQLIKSAVSAPGIKRPRVFFAVWAKPLLTVGPKSYMNDAITICGGTNIAEGIAGDYPHYSTERLLVEQPDVIILPHEADTSEFLKSAPWSSMNAVKEHRVYFLPEKQNDYLSRPTMRLIKGLYWLADKIHPEIKLR
jgi:iron complex transport system substrate-binding protein